MPVLFVYGTLKRGRPNHTYLENSEFLGMGRVYGYTLLVNGLPYAVESPPDCCVEGELYRVDERVLEKIDRLEGHPWAYRRVMVDARTQDGKSIEAYMYVWPYASVNRCLSYMY